MGAFYDRSNQLVCLVFLIIHYFAWNGHHEDNIQYQNAENIISYHDVDIFEGVIIAETGPTAKFTFKCFVLKASKARK